MKIVANTEYLRKIFDSEEQACEFFNIDLKTLNEHINSGKSLPKGCRYFYVDELTEV